MSYELYQGDPYDKQAKIAFLLRLHQYARLQRINFEWQWEESSALVWPDLRNSFSFGHVRAPGVKYTQYQVDSSATVRAMRFMAIADALVTPFNMIWSRVTCDNPDLLKDRAAQRYFDDWTRVLWTERYKPEANFQTSQQTNWLALMVLGNQGMWADELDPHPGRFSPGLRYINCWPGEIYLLVNHQGRIDGCIRHFRWNAYQAHQRWGTQIPPQLLSALEKGDVYTLYDFLQFVLPNTFYDPHDMFTFKGKPWWSLTVSMAGWDILEEGGYYDFPLAYGRYSVAPEEWYGRGPVQLVLPEYKTKNAEKEAFLKQGVMAGDPAWALPEDGLADFKAMAGAYNYGAMSPDGRLLIAPLPTGNIQITKELMDDSDKILDAAALVDLFPLLFGKDNRQRSARETVEVANQMSIFLAPTLGRQFGEYLGTMIRREMGLLHRLGKSPDMPPSVAEAKGDFRFLYTSPLGRSLNAQGIAGIMRTVEMTSQIAQASGDPSVWDRYNFDNIVLGMATEQFAPANWLASDRQMADKRRMRAQVRERERQVREMPGRAAMAKAQAIQIKAGVGGNIGGTLSGTPEGGMPIVPGNPPGQPGRPGVGGAPGLSGRPA